MWPKQKRIHRGIAALDHEDIMESLELFAKEVMPEFKDRHHLQQKCWEEQLDGVKFRINSSTSRSGSNVDSDVCSTSVPLGGVQVRSD